MSEQFAGNVFEAARQGRTSWLRVHGPATLAVAAILKQFGMAAISGGCERMIMDVADCSTMDSTIMGVLAGLAARMARQGGVLLIVNVPDNIFSAFSTLGLDRLIQCRRAGVTPDEAWSDLVVPLQNLKSPEKLSDNPGAARDLMLEAHTELAGLSADNQLRFKDVLTFLREDLAGKQ